MWNGEHAAGVDARGPSASVRRERLSNAASSFITSSIMVAAGSAVKLARSVLDSRNHQTRPPPRPRMLWTRRSRR